MHTSHRWPHATEMSRLVASAMWTQSATVSNFVDNGVEVGWWRHYTQKVNIHVPGGGARYEFLLFCTVLLFRLFAITADCRRLNLHHSTQPNSTVSSRRRRPYELSKWQRQVFSVSLCPVLCGNVVCSTSNERFLMQRAINSQYLKSVCSVMSCLSVLSVTLEYCGQMVG